MKRRILRAVGGILLIPLFAVIVEAVSAYSGVYKSPHPWPLWFKAVAIICAIVGGPMFELASEKNPPKMNGPQTKGSTRTSPSAVFRATVGTICVLTGSGLFMRFLIRCATAFKPDAALPGREVFVGTVIPLLLMIIAAYFFVGNKKG